jgi:hypothetical protein
MHFSASSGSVHFGSRIDVFALSILAIEDVCQAY